MVVMSCREEDIVDKTQGFPEQGLGVVADRSHSPVAFVWLPRESLRTGLFEVAFVLG